MKMLEIKCLNGANTGHNGFVTTQQPADRNGHVLPPGSSLKIERSIAYMAQHLDQPLQIARLAALANISPSHYFALFRRSTGCAPIDFFIRLRMRHACELLEETALSVKEIAAELGYEDPFYFSRTFKSVNRVAPSEYRTMSKESRDELKSFAVRRNRAEEVQQPDYHGRNGACLATERTGFKPQARAEYARKATEEKAGK